MRVPRPLTCIKLHLCRGVLEVVTRDQHLAVDVLGALGDVGGEGRQEAQHVEAELVGGADGEAGHHGQQAQVHVETGHLTGGQGVKSGGEPVVRSGARR